MNMLASAKESIERSMATPSRKGYTSLARNQADNHNDSRFYDEQLRSDGWHLDEVEDDDELDFHLPPSRQKEQEQCPCLSVCGCVIS